MDIVYGGFEDVEAFMALWRAVWPERLRSADEFRADISELPEEFRIQFWLAKLAGNPVGFAEAYRIPASGGTWTVEVGVLPQHRQHRIGERLYEAADRVIQEGNPLQVLTRVAENDPDSLGYAKKRGFTERKRDFESQLDPRTVPDSLLEDWASPIPGIKIVPVAQLDSEAFRRRFLALVEAIRPDVPRSTPVEPIDFAFFNDHVVGDPAFRREGSFVAMAGDELIGMSASYEGDSAEESDQWLTGVVREWRGRGIARSLKAHAIRWAKANGVCRVRTDNDTQNAAMLAINDQLGYARKLGLITLGKS